MFIKWLHVLNIRKRHEISKSKNEGLETVIPTRQTEIKMHRGKRSINYQASLSEWMADKF